ncbi:family 78 glycoside hydrolase catalytic domain [Microbacterium sp. ISL-103]|uniref:family 78 glycoside hydrolase catalytic domain n=1 Tax=Microbacterium sp. ISL-103 TaxID=2819156 RepID=UPI001BEB7BC8|nr:family 78 glycoside hydrolase catalytic domain [Microbacterium sp. ISL-103]MBT2474661.1 family 78 glycoside hydrolase catalytic domain [Microbacterium sp. ISL-103]
MTTARPTLTKDDIVTISPDSLDGATFIGATAPEGVAPRFTLEVDLEQPRTAVTSATLFATAHGVYEASVDGLPVTASVLNPGWTSYEWRLACQEYDVSEAIQHGSGKVRLDLLLGNGWYRGRLGFAGADANYGDEISVAAVLEVTFADGIVQRIVTSDEWAAEASDITRNSLYNGQTTDARLRAGGQALDVHTVDVDRATLMPQSSPLVVRNETLSPVEISTSPSGRTLVDFGQNLVGWVRFTVAGERGTRIRIRHAEVLEDGELGVRPLRGAEATDEFILSGDVDSFEPTFTFHGFRYIEVDGWPGDLEQDNVEAVVVHSEMERTGYFTCSEPLVNQLVHNSVWGQKGNFLSVPTDCPQRDERLGWTGDLSAYAASANFQFDTADFLDGWLRDLLEETRHTDGQVVPLIVPDVLKYAHFPDGFSLPWHRATAVWGDAAIWVPQALWWSYGDAGRLADYYPAMVMHLDSIEQDVSETGLWDRGNQLGDWLDPDAPPEDPAAAKADPSVVATACLYRSASFAADAADVLGLADDATRWRALSERTRNAFVENYVKADGIVLSDCPTVYAPAISFGVLEGDLRDAAGRRLAELVQASGYRVTTGFAGTPFVTWALSETGHLNDAYRLLLERENPSWMYPVVMGATTVWERWDSMLPDGTINTGEMTSFNHYALGAVVDWVYQVIGGIRPAEPGYASVRIQPQPGPGIDWAETSYRTVNGPVSCAWRVEGGRLVSDVSLPEMTPAEIVLPDGSQYEVTGGSHQFIGSFGLEGHQ